MLHETLICDYLADVQKSAERCKTLMRLGMAQCTWQLSQWFLFADRCHCRFLHCPTMELLVLSYSKQLIQIIL